MSDFRCNCDECRRHDEATTISIGIARKMAGSPLCERHYENVKWILDKHGYEIHLDDGVITLGLKP